MPQDLSIGSGFKFADILGKMFQQRQPTGSETDFFRRRPEVAGYAAPDQSVVMNPAFNGNTDAVLLNERLRHVFNANPQLVPSQMTIAEHQRLSGGYQDDEQALRSSILARMLSGDTSLSPYTFQQYEAIKGIDGFLQSLGMR